MRVLILRAGGGLLVLLGAIHLAATPHIARFVEQAATPEAGPWLTPPMLLNHVVVGILLLPLGGLTLYAAPHAAVGARWALMTARVAALTVSILPLAVFFLMGTRYFEAWAFRVATGIACAAAAALLLAAFWPATRAVE